MSGHLAPPQNSSISSCTHKGKYRGKIIMPSSKCQLPLRLSLSIYVVINPKGV
uniref:Uncharacterized protein n=1 Tax=Rhizophora mucronata TaxID=61149 RepID=A0A2P2LMG4_RHIMU